LQLEQQLVWLRNDLRLDDNPALALAQQQGPIRVVYVSTPEQWRQHHESPARLGLKAAAVQDVASRLAGKGIAFDHLECDSFDSVVEQLLGHCTSLGIQQLWFNAETPLDEQRRDQAVSELLADHDIAIQRCEFDLLVSREVLNLQGLPFKVFTPFYKRWLQYLDVHAQPPYPEPRKQGKAIACKPLTLSWAGEFRSDLWPAEESAALQRLTAFCQQRLHSYPQLRDIPSVAGTSSLSPYLANGQLGPRRCVDTIKLCCAQAGRDWHSDDWLRELAWRDFYRQLMHHFPRLSKGRPFRLDTERIKWNNSDEDFQAWCEGRTGFPIVDAAMRQLRQTGWMHNRLRMVAASFLSKILFVDWRRGEQYFMQQLIDGEFAANNGGWQWSASTGCDAAPYFRVFNPTRQSQRFDPQGEFIRRFVPELSSLSAKAIHLPSVEDCQNLAYPLPIVDYKLARAYAIDSFKALKTAV
jgi:deoxyribodipyrimidine photo-lyase